MNSAVEQFVSDFTLVVDNDKEAYDEARETAGQFVHLHEVSDAMREQYETAIGYAIELIEVNNGEVSDVIISLMKQILLGWGQPAFDRIARHYMEEVQ